MPEIKDLLTKEEKEELGRRFQSVKDQISLDRYVRILVGTVFADTVKKPDGFSKPKAIVYIFMAWAVFLFTWGVFIR